MNEKEREFVWRAAHKQLHTSVGISIDEHEREDIDAVTDILFGYMIGHLQTRRLLQDDMSSEVSIAELQELRHLSNELRPYIEQVYYA